MACELQGSARSKRAEFWTSKEGSPQEQVGSRGHGTLQLGDSPPWPLEAQLHWLEIQMAQSQCLGKA